MAKYQTSLIKEAEGSTKDIRAGTITPTIYVGEAKAGEEVIQLLTTWGKSPVVEFEDGSVVIWTWQDLIDEARAIKEAEEAKANG